MNDRERVEQLERQVRTLHATRDRVRARNASQLGISHRFLGRLESPVEDGTLTFPLEFVEGTFEEETNTDGATFEVRSTGHFAHSFLGVTPAADMAFPMLRADGQWWAKICYCANLPDSGELDDCVLHQDTFNRPDNTDINDGITPGTPLGAALWTDTGLGGAGDIVGGNLVGPFTLVSGTVHSDSAENFAGNAHMSGEFAAKVASTFEFRWEVNGALTAYKSIKIKIRSDSKLELVFADELGTTTHISDTAKGGGFEDDLRWNLCVSWSRGMVSYAFGSFVDTDGASLILSGQESYTTIDANSGRVWILMNDASTLGGFRWQKQVGTCAKGCGFMANCETICDTIDALPGSLLVDFRGVAFRKGRVIHRTSGDDVGLTACQGLGQKIFVVGRDNTFYPHHGSTLLSAECRWFAYFPGLVGSYRSPDTNEPNPPYDDCTQKPVTPTVIMELVFRTDGLPSPVTGNLLLYITVQHFDPTWDGTGGFPPPTDDIPPKVYCAQYDYIVYASDNIRLSDYNDCPQMLRDGIELSNRRTFSTFSYNDWVFGDPLTGPQCYFAAGGNGNVIIRSP